MSGYHTRPKADEDLVEGARWIRADNPQAARRFLDAAFNAFDRLAEFPEAGPLARFKNRKLAAAVQSLVDILSNHRQTGGNNPGDLRNAKLARKADFIFYLRTTP